MEGDGRSDFDFLAGRWDVVNRKLDDPTPEAAARWHGFRSFAESRSILGGLGNYDDHLFPDFPGRGECHGLAFRLFDFGQDMWRIWWGSDPGSGDLAPPLLGHFQGGEGHFEGDDVYEGRSIRVRFKWYAITPVSARWEQAFSFGDDAPFEVNWIMGFRRVVDAGGRA